MRKAAIIQSNYLPWKGYFHIINSVDVFVFLDSVQYTSGDWRNRNRIKIPEGTIWLTVPVSSSGKLIKEKRIISASDWQKKHYLTLERYYAKSPYWKKYHPFLEDIYLHKNWEFLSELNKFTTKEISTYLGIKCNFLEDCKLDNIPGKNERIIHLLKQIGADTYVSGPSALSYLDQGIFDRHNIKLEIFEYPQYPQYKQLWNDFEQNVSILDLLLNLGDKTGEYIWGNIGKTAG